MSYHVGRTKHENIAVLIVDHRLVNALSPRVPEGIFIGLDAALADSLDIKELERAGVGDGPGSDLSAPL
jgi:hypothetical protein